MSGAAPASGDSRRKYHRFHLREQAVLRYAAGTFAVYTKDVSRMGMGVMVPEQLFPCDEFELLMPGEQWISLIVRRCRRVQEECYDVGAEFAAGILNPGRYKQMIQHVGL
ncbi:MAG: PilZ domain-containing protein [Planctomycetales bacterium]|nr:PilZ domain-containing protein [Planctomycetales bacterium]